MKTPPGPSSFMRIVGVFVALVVPLSTAPVTLAATLTWDADGIAPAITDGSGNWDVGGASTWLNGASSSTFSTGDDVIFGGGTSGTAGLITLLSSLSAGSLTFNAPFAGNYTIGGGPNVLKSTEPATARQACARAASQRPPQRPSQRRCCSVHRKSGARACSPISP